MLTAIRKWVVQTMMKSKSQTGVVQNLPKRDLIEMIVQITAERLMRNGVDPNELKNANQVENAINSIENRPLPAQEGIRTTKSAKVFDIDGNPIDPSKGIIGGKQMKPIKQGEAITSENFGSSQFAPDNQYGFGRDRKIDKKTLEKELMKTDNPFSDLVKTTNQKPKSLKEREAEVLARMEKENKEAVQRIRDRKRLEDRALEDFVDDAGGVNPDDPRGIDDFIPDPEDMAQGGRAGFKAGLGKRFLELLKGKPKPKFDVERFRKGPIDLKFLENIDKKDLAPFIRSRDTMGPGGYGMYDNFADMPAGLKAAELIKTIKGPRNEINYKAAELFLGKKLKGNESADELIQMLNRQEMRADGGRIGYADGTPDKKGILDMIDVQASGSKSGKQQIPGAPEGITIDSESLNAIAKADIPISQKVDLILEYKYGKGRDRIEDKGQEIFLDEGGYKDQDIGFGYNQDGEGFSGSVMRDLRTGDDDFKIRFLKRFANGGRIGLKAGMTKRAFLKLMGGVGAGIAGLKSGLLGIGKEAAPAVEAVKETVTQAPSYFFDLVAKIKLLGEPRRTPSYRERVNEYQYTGKDGNEYLLTEELDTGDIMIQKDKLGGRNYGDESYEVIEDRTEMVFKKGQADETTKGTPADEYEEYKVEFDQDGTAADATNIDEISKKEIIKEATEDAPPIKKAGGGIARMLGE